MHDRLHEPYRWPLIQGGSAVRKAAMDAGAWGCVISGAGPSLLALCPPEKGRAWLKPWRRAGSKKGSYRACR